VLLVQLRSTKIAQIDCFPAYCSERVTVAFVYDCSPVASGGQVNDQAVAVLTKVPEGIGRDQH
jgi:hypothetical protein